MPSIRLHSALSWLRKWLGGDRMCLATVKRTDHSSLIESGWKKFGGSNTTPCFENQALNGKMEVPLDTWIAADTSKQIKATDGQRYRSGFHIYVEELDQNTWSKRVFFRHAEIGGQQDGRECVVAREMFVPSNPNDWPPLET